MATTWTSRDTLRALVRIMAPSPLVDADALIAPVLGTLTEALAGDPGLPQRDLALERAVTSLAAQLDDAVDDADRRDLRECLERLVPAAPTSLPQGGVRARRRRAPRPSGWGAKYA